MEKNTIKRTLIGQIIVIWIFDGRKMIFTRTVKKLIAECCNFLPNLVIFAENSHFVYKFG